MNDLLLQIDFKSPIRIGMPGRDDQATRESISAEQLFSWLSLGWIQLFGKDDFQKMVIEPFLANEHPWHHTDLFPYANKSIWLPTPRSGASKVTATELIDRKHFKSWVAWDAFFSVLQEERSLKPVDSSSPVKTDLLNNVRIRRSQGEDNTPFYTAAVTAKRFARAGTTNSTNESDDILETCTSFAGLVKCFKPELEDKLGSICDFMADFGLGGGRSSGLGTIANVTLEKLPSRFKIPSPKIKRGVHVLLSPCCPTDQMLMALQASPAGSNSYTISARAGWVYDEHGRATDIRKPTVRSFDTGATFSVKPQGKLVSVGTESYPAYRYGIPFCVEA